MAGFFIHMESIKVRQNPGCLAALFGKDIKIEEYNMLVFSNMDDKIKSNSNVISDEWVCIKCSYTNRKTALFCNNCGEKK